MEAIGYMIIGYARRVTISEDIEIQNKLLIGAGCEKIYEDVARGPKALRPQLMNALEQLKSGDTFVICTLDRIGTSLKNLVEIINKLSKKGVNFISINENINTNKLQNNLYSIFELLAHYDHELVIERTSPGLETARARGKKGGRKSSLDDSQIEAALKLYSDKNKSIKEICQEINISKPTLYRIINKAKERSLDK